MQGASYRRLLALGYAEMRGVEAESLPFGRALKPSPPSERRQVVLVVAHLQQCGADGRTPKSEHDASWEMGTAYSTTLTANSQEPSATSKGITSNSLDVLKWRTGRAPSR